MVLTVGRCGVFFESGLFFGFIKMFFAFVWAVVRFLHLFQRVLVGLTGVIWILDLLVFIINWVFKEFVVTVTLWPFAVTTGRGTVATAIERKCQGWSGRQELVLFIWNRLFLVINLLLKFPLCLNPCLMILRVLIRILFNNVFLGTWHYFLLTLCVAFGVAFGVA